MTTWNEIRLPVEEERLWELFHENSKLSPVSPVHVLEEDIDDQLERMHVSLPVQCEFIKSLEEEKDALFQRVFYRQFADDTPLGGSISFAALSRIFLASGAVTRRDSSSGTSLSPLELYGFITGIDGLPQGLYHFDHEKLGIQLINEDVSRDQISQALPGDEGSHVYIFITALFERTTIPYGERGYRIALTESGQVMQNIILASAMQSLSARPIINFYDRKLEQVLGIDGVNHVLLQVIAISETSSYT